MDRRPMEPPPNETVKDAPEAGEVIRRVEVVVERRVCSVEVHAPITLPPGVRCPVCGSLPSAEGTVQSPNHAVKVHPNKITGGY
jgi:hypothetical protein